MKLYINICATLLILNIIGCSTTVPSLESVKHRVQLIEANDKHAKYHAKKFERIEDPIVKKLALKKNYSQWKRYEDEYVSFIYPDEPNVKLEIKKPEDRIPVSGGVVGTTENTFFRTYRLVIGEETYCALLLDEVNSFDDGICFCGAIEYQKLLVDDGVIFRYDLLENGSVKKIQALSDRYRVVVFEWTHLPIQQDPYIRIGSSIRFKKPGGGKKLRNNAIAKYGGIGFLERGMTKVEVIKLLGNPTVDGDSKLVYDRVDGRDVDRYTVPIDSKGLFSGFGVSCYEYIKLPPEYGSADWIIEKVSAASGGHALFGDDDKDYDLGSLTAKDIRYIFERFQELTPEMEDDEWRGLCQAIHKLADMGHKDERVLGVVREKFKRGYVNDEAHWIIDKYKPADYENLLIDQVKKGYAKADAEYARWESDGGKNVKEEFGDDFDINEDMIFGLGLHNLFCFLGDESNRAHDMILIGMKHKHPAVRAEAYSFWHYLPSPLSGERLRQGLADNSYSVRRECAEEFADEVGTKADLPVLKKVREIEENEEVLEFIEAAINRISSL